MQPCPCASGKDYAECCQPYLEGGQLAPTAEALMRSRYTAFAKVNVEHLENTLHPKSRKGFDPEPIKQWAEAADWTGLEVLETTGGGENDTTGTVHFVARYEVQGAGQDYDEVAQFVKEDGQWFYLDGEVKGHVPYRREAPKIGRNDPCPCGSGKKYKKCCL